DGWILGYPAGFDRAWNHLPYMVDGKEQVYLGASLTAALFFLRLYYLTGEENYLIHGKDIGEKLCLYGWDKDRGYWLTSVEKEPPYRPTDSQSVQWWIQIYGALLQLHLYHVTGEEHYLENFRKSESFYERYFRDHEYGGVFSGVTPDGSFFGKGEKAGPWHTSYHEIEHGFLNYLYLNLYVNKKPVVLHFQLDGPATHFVSPVDDPNIKIMGVTINGGRWTNFDPLAHSITVPPGKNLHVQVTLGP
ncbi:MAG: AGE family epimerase/isomerase, partial [Bacteroidota bacterium]